MNIRGPTVKIVQWVNAPILWLSLLGTVIAMIWLVIVGERWVLLYGIGGSLLSYMLGLVAVLQFLLFRAARRQAASARRLRGLLLVIVAQLLTYGVVSVWCHLTFAFFVSKATSSTMLPLLAVSWGVALAPWHSLTSRESDEEPYHGHGEFLLLVSQIAYLLGVVAYIARDTHGLPREPVDAMRAVAATDFSLVFYGVLRVGLIIHTVAAVYDHVIAVETPSATSRPDKPPAIGFTMALLSIALCIDGVRTLAVPWNDRRSGAYFGLVISEWPAHWCHVPCHCYGCQRHQRSANPSRGSLARVARGTRRCRPLSRLAA